jgi:hypothetical protein
MDGRVRVWFAPGLFPPGQEPYRIGGDLETAAAGSMMSKAATCSHGKVLWARLRQPAGRLAYSTATRTAAIFAVGLGWARCRDVEACRDVGRLPPLHAVVTFKLPSGLMREQWRRHALSKR